MSAFFGAKSFEIYGVSARRREVEPVRTRREGEPIFYDFVRTSFMDGPLGY